MEGSDLPVEEVRVMEKAPLVNTTSASVSHDFEFVSSLPRTGPRARISLAPPGHRPRLAADLPAALAGGHDLVFPALAPETLRSGAMAQRVPLATWRWPVSLRRQLYPAVRPEAYLAATLRSPAATPLPAGEASLFLDGQPTGHARLELVRPGQPFTLPLGVDRTVRATRRVQLDSSREGLISKDEVDRYTVTIDIANAHRRGVALDVFDQLPRPGHDAVEVELVSSAPPAKLDERGTLTWHLGLAAGRTVQLRFVYRLKHPGSTRLHQ